MCVRKYMRVLAHACMRVRAYMLRLRACVCVHACTRMHARARKPVTVRWSMRTKKLTHSGAYAHTQTPNQLSNYHTICFRQRTRLVHTGIVMKRAQTTHASSFFLCTWSFSWWLIMFIHRCSIGLAACGVGGDTRRLPTFESRFEEREEEPALGSVRYNDARTRCFWLPSHFVLSKFKVCWMVILWESTWFKNMHLCLRSDWVCVWLIANICKIIIAQQLFIIITPSVLFETGVKWVRVYAFVARAHTHAQCTCYCLHAEKAQLNKSPLKRGKWVVSFAWKRHNRGRIAVPLLSGVFVASGSKSSTRCPTTVTCCSQRSSRCFPSCASAHPQRRVTNVTCCCCCWWSTHTCGTIASHPSYSHAARRRRRCIDSVWGATPWFSLLLWLPTATTTHDTTAASRSLPATSFPLLPNARLLSAITQHYDAVICVRVPLWLLRCAGDGFATPPCCTPRCSSCSTGSGVYRGSSAEGDYSAASMPVACVARGCATPCHSRCRACRCRVYPSATSTLHQLISSVFVYV